MSVSFKKKFFKRLAILSWIWCVILLVLKIINYEGLMSPESPLYMFIILETFFLVGGLLLFFKAKKL